LTVVAGVDVLDLMSGSRTGRMKDWRKRTLSWRKVATVAAAVLAVGLGYHVMFGQNGLTAYEQKRVEARTLEQQLKSLERENGQLKGHVDRLQSDPNAIEHQAREELHYTRPGEVIYTLPDFPAESKKSADSR
jgi:cell division protein FtsB